MVEEVIDNTVDNTPQGNQVEQPARVDYDSAIAAITAELNSVRQTSDAAKAKADKYDRVAEAFTGETDKRVKTEKFFTDFANDPGNTLKQYVGDVSKSELSQLREDLREIKLKDFDTMHIKNLQANDKDFGFVWENMSKVINEKDWNEYKDKDNRTEITYGMAKARLAKAMNTNREEENKQIEQAKNLVNQTAVSARPASGVEVKSEDEYTRRQNELSSARDSFDHDKVRTMLTNDIGAVLNIK
jgi:hypothetical protein